LRKLGNAGEVNEWCHKPFASNWRS